MLPRLVWSIAAGKLSPQESGKIADDILARARDPKSLYMMVSDIAKRLG